MADDLDPSDAAVAAALTGPLPGDERADQLLELEELAEEAGVSVPLLEAFVREGLLLPAAGSPDRYRAGDAASVRAAIALVDAGLPLAELLELARRADGALRPIADHAVELFTQYIRDPAVGLSDSDEEAAERMIGALHAMLPATEQLVAQHLRRLLLRAAVERLTAEQAEAE
ncbi:MAG: hypothetical protein R3320_00785 [Nitriliruptorales bacterium]|nr:hypothetical protein [Nitriliruptorales bacterium]